MQQPTSTFLGIAAAAALTAMGIAPELQRAVIHLAFEVIWEMPVQRACNRNDTEYDARAA